MLFQTRGRLYHPPSLLSEGFKARMQIASFTLLSNPLCSTDNIFVFSIVMLWLGLSVVYVYVLRPLMWWNSVSCLQWVFGFPNICGFTFFTTNLIYWANHFVLPYWIFVLGVPTTVVECLRAWSTLVLRIHQRFFSVLFRRPSYCIRDYDW